MATVQKLTDHFLTCTVCHEIFTDPSTLHCGHSFCGHCIVGFTKTRADAIRSKSIPCPFCRRLTEVPDPSRPVEEWAGQMKPAHLLKGLLDTIGPGAKGISNCNWCRDEGEIVPAVSWCPACDVSLCSNCLKAHRGISSTKNHDVSDITEEVKVRRRTRVTYQEHKEEIVKFFCRDCRRALCQSCCILYHRKCKTVVTLESMLPEMRSSLETRRDTLINKSRVEEEQVGSLKSRCRELEESKSSIQSQIRSTAQKVIDVVKEKDRELLDKLNEVTDKEMDQLQAGIKTRDIACNIYNQQAYLIDQAIKSEGEMEIYGVYQSSESEAAASVGNVKKRGTRHKIEYSQNVDRIERAVSEWSLGKIQVLYVSSPVLNHTVDFGTKDDLDEPQLFDIVSMELKGSDTVVVTDYNNKCIKYYFRRNNQQLHGRLSMKSRPACITKLDDNKIAVSLPRSKQIAVVSVTPDLTLDSTIRTQKMYTGLTALTPTTLAAGSVSPPCVDIIDRKGNVMRSISLIHNGKKIIQKPGYLSATRKGNILVSDNVAKSVVCVTPQGEVVFNYSPTGNRELIKPAGITSTATGHILVADYHVTLLNEAGEFVRDLLTSQEGIRLPFGIDWDKRGRVYVTHYSEVNGDTVQVFTFE